MELIKTIRKTIDKGSGYVLLFNYILAKSGGKHTKHISMIFLTKYSGLSISQINAYFKDFNYEFIINSTNKLTVSVTKENVSTKYEQVEPKTANSEKEAKLIDRVILTLNEVTGKNFGLKTKSNRSPIRARIREGMQWEDFEYVIRIKTMEWLDTNDLYLRPFTLFGTKMDSYRNQKIINTDKPKLLRINEAIHKAKEYDWESDNKS